METVVCEINVKIDNDDKFIIKIPKYCKTCDVVCTEYCNHQEETLKIKADRWNWKLRANNDIVHVENGVDINIIEVIKHIPVGVFSWIFINKNPKDLRKNNIQLELKYPKFPINVEVFRYYPPHTSIKLFDDGAKYNPHWIVADIDRIDERYILMQCSNGFFKFSVEDYDLLTCNPNKEDHKLTWNIGRDMEGELTYVQTSSLGNPKYMHSFIFPGSNHHMSVDHINQDKRDNRRFNLRLVSNGVQNVNRPKHINNKARKYPLPDGITMEMIPKHVSVGYDKDNDRQYFYICGHPYKNAVKKTSKKARTYTPLEKLQQIIVILDEYDKLFIKDFEENPNDYQKAFYNEVYNYIKNTRIPMNNNIIQDKSKPPMPHKGKNEITTICNNKPNNDIPEEMNVTKMIKIDCIPIPKISQNIISFTKFIKYDDKSVIATTDDQQCMILIDNNDDAKKTILQFKFVYTNLGYIVDSNSLKLPKLSKNTEELRNRITLIDVLFGLGSGFYKYQMNPEALSKVIILGSKSIYLIDYTKVNVGISLKDDLTIPDGVKVFESYDGHMVTRVANDPIKNMFWRVEYDKTICYMMQCVNSMCFFSEEDIEVVLWNGKSRKTWTMQNDFPAMHDQTSTTYLKNVIFENKNGRGHMKSYSIKNINGNKMDCRRNNIEEVSSSDNNKKKGVTRATVIDGETYDIPTYVSYDAQKNRFRVERHPKQGKARESFTKAKYKSIENAFAAACARLDELNR